MYLCSAWYLTLLPFCDGAPEQLLDLAADRVPNVRLAVSQLLSEPAWKSVLQQSSDPRAAGVLERLKEDPSADVNQPLRPSLPGGSSPMPGRLARKPLVPEV